jgi:hypothetical protein
MQPPDNRPVLRPNDADTVPFAATAGAVTNRHVEPPARQTGVPPKLARMLLPQEHVTFGSTPHPIVFALPLALMIAIAVALALGLSDLLHPAHSHAAFLSGPWRMPGIVAGGALFAFSGVLLIRRWARFAGLRIVSTNRRIFAIRGVLVRRITPLGNTALAASTLSQGFFGRMFGYGSISLPLADGTPDAFRDMRDALELYREFQAVAHGIDGDTWTPAVRQTLIP